MPYRYLGINQTPSLWCEGYETHLKYFLMRRMGLWGSHEFPSSWILMGQLWIPQNSFHHAKTHMDSLGFCSLSSALAWKATRHGSHCSHNPKDPEYDSSRWWKTLTLPTWSLLCRHAKGKNFRILEASTYISKKSLKARQCTRGSECLQTAREWASFKLWG